MKKLICLTACALALAGPARAETGAADDYFHPYAGVDLLRMNLDYNDNYDLGGVSVDLNQGLNDSLDGLNIHVGNRFTKYFGAELGYFKTKSEKDTSVIGTTKVSAQGVTLDGLGYIPLGEDERVDLIGTAGVTWIKAKVSLDVPGLGSASDNDDEFGFRVGAGAQFNFTKQISARGLVRYQSADFDDYADEAITYTVGLNYAF
jgi:opacity protein-like surface antigen